MKKSEIALTVCYGWLAWGAVVDAQGSPVIDQVLMVVVFGFIAIFYAEK